MKTEEHSTFINLKWSGYKSIWKIKGEYHDLYRSSNTAHDVDARYGKENATVWKKIDM